MNLIEIAGRLGADAEVRQTSGGQKVVNLRVATNSKRKGQEETIWWRVTLWGDRWDRLLPFLKKGSAVIINGELSKPEVWTDKSGQPQVSLDIRGEIVRFSPFGKGGDGSDGGASTTQSADYGGGDSGFAEAGSGMGQGGGDAMDDDLPF